MLSVSLLLALLPFFSPSAAASLLLLLKVPRQAPFDTAPRQQLRVYERRDAGTDNKRLSGVSDCRCASLRRGVRSRTSAYLERLTPEPGLQNDCCAAVVVISHGGAPSFTFEFRHHKDLGTVRRTFRAVGKRTRGRDVS